MIFEGDTITGQVTVTNKSSIYTSTIHGYFEFQGEQVFYTETLNPLESMVVISGAFSGTSSGTSELIMGGDYVTGMTITVHPTWDALSITNAVSTDYLKGYTGSIAISFENLYSSSLTVPYLELKVGTETTTYNDVVIAAGTSSQSFDFYVNNDISTGLTNLTINLVKEGFTTETFVKQINVLPNAATLLSVTRSDISAVVAWTNVSGTSQCILDVSKLSNFSTHHTGYPATFNPAVTSSTVWNLESGTTYYFRVRDYWGGQWINYSNVIDITTKFSEYVTFTENGGIDVTNLSSATTFTIMQNATSEVHSIYGEWRTTSASAVTYFDEVIVSGAYAYSNCTTDCSDNQDQQVIITGVTADSRLYGGITLGGWANDPDGTLNATGGIHITSMISTNPDVIVSGGYLDWDSAYNSSGVQTYQIS